MYNKDIGDHVMEYLDKIKERFSGKEITLETNFKELGLDSLDLVDMVFELEEEVGITFEDDELVSIKTVKDLLDLIDAKK